MTTAIVSTVTNKLSKVSFKLKKHSPEILMITGAIGVVASAVMACKATTKVQGILEDAKSQIDTVHKFAEDKDMNESGRYTQEDAKKDLAIIYLQTGVKFVKLYAPSVIFGALSLTSMLASNNILKKRNVALAAAYATVDKSYKEYRNRVIERFGEVVDKELRYNIKSQKIEETIKDEETGKEKKVKKNVDVVETDDIFGSPYAKIFDDGCRGWEKDPEMNLMFLRAQQQYANDLLVTRGHLFLNEVYDMLGIERTRAGQVVGWVYDPENPKGDNYVDFGIYNTNRKKSRDFVNGIERVILLDFNVDGEILDLI